METTPEEASNGPDTAMTLPHAKTEPAVTFVLSLVRAGASVAVTVRQPGTATGTTAPVYKKGAGSDVISMDTVTSASLQVNTSTTVAMVHERRVAFVSPHSAASAEP
jgi:hypothetical protein